MKSALYDPDHGYYMSGSERTGWRGDFVTSPELDPAFGHLWGRGLLDIWIVLDRPGRFDVVEVGPGEGGFARSLLGGAPKELLEALHLTLVEIDAGRRARSRGRALGPAGVVGTDIESVTPFEAGVVFANEVLDNQPVHVLRNRAGGFQELHVDAADEGLVEVWLDCTDEELIERALASDSPAGAEIEISLAAETLALRCAGLPRRGGAIFVDYGKRADRSHAGGTIATYSSTGASTRTLADPGASDLTVHVDWAAIKEACLQEEGVTTFGPITQRKVLAALGAHEIDDDLRSRYKKLIDSGRRSRRRRDSLAKAGNRRSAWIPGGSVDSRSWRLCVESRPPITTDSPRGFCRKRREPGSPSGSSTPPPSGPSCCSERPRAPGPPPRTASGSEVAPDRRPSE